MNATTLYAKVAELGLSVDQLLELSDQVLAEAGETPKQASLFGPITEGVHAVTGLGNAAWPAIWLSLLAPPALGYGAGKQLANFFDADSQDVKELQEEELIRELEQNAMMLRGRKELKNKQLSKSPVK